MSTLSAAQIAHLAKKAGWKTDKQVRGVSEVVMGTAIALAESGGDTRAHNNESPRDNSYGLYQINMLGDMGSQRRAQFNLENNEELFNPTTNANVAYQLWTIQGWEAWSVFTNGLYARQLGKARAGARDPDSNIPATGETGGVTGDSDGGLVAFLENQTLRAVMFVAGVVLIIVAVVLMMQRAGAKQLRAVIRKAVKDVGAA